MDSRHPGTRNSGETSYYRARYYDPAAGRFLSEDPIRLLGGNNFYRYVKNRPIDFRDPSGLCPRTGPCILNALKKEAFSFIVDAAGAIPVEGNLLSAVQLTVGIVGGIPQYAKDPVVATGTFAGVGVVLMGLSEEYGKAFSKTAPVIGNIISAAFAIRDIIHGVEDFQSCMKGE